MRSCFVSGIAVLFAVTATVSAGAKVEGRQAIRAGQVLARASHQSLYTWNSQPKHAEAAFVEHVPRPKYRKHKL